MDFILILSGTSRGHDNIFLVVERFSKISHFLSCSKSNAISHIARPFFWKIMRLYEIPKIIVFDRDVKFLSYFQTKYWKLIKLN